MMKSHRYTLADVKQAANGNWHAILTALGVSETLLNKNKHQPCPACGGKDRFRFTDNGGRGWWICNTCTPKGGSGFDLLMLVFGCSFDEALQRVAGVLGMNGNHQAPAFRLPENKTPPIDEKKAEIDERNQLKLLSIWDNALNWQHDDIVPNYLRGRGIPEAENLPFHDDGLRCSRLLPYWHNGRCLGRFPAMVGAFRAVDGELVGLHFTYLMKKQGIVSKAILKDPQTGALLDVKKHRAMYSGALMGAAIPLFRLPEHELNGVLVVCEGIETAAAIHCVNGLNVWACGAANRVAGFRLPDMVRRLVIIADNDPNGAGLQAAQALQRRYQVPLQGNIKIWQPESDNDVLDLLARETKGKDYHG
ncbi:primase-helicase zinc-binding domain-containing protein [Alysiella crassa]|nr:primase-helicase zinc-binding domain-containing protein [Alysiella crassa]UOP07726.1 toprim domain-containing protein [Alysiella crassa]